MPRYTDAVSKTIKWYRANLKTALLHNFTDMIIKVELGKITEEELFLYRLNVIRSLAQPVKDYAGIEIAPPPFGRVFAASMVLNWYKEATMLVDVYKRVAPEGLGRETRAVEIIMDQLRETIEQVALTKN